MFALAGVNNGLSRDLPYYIGKSDDKTSRLLASTALMYLIGAGALVLVGGCGCLVAFHNSEKKVLFAIAVVTVLILFTFYTNYLVVTFRSSQSFRNLTKVRLAEGLCGLATIPLFYFLGYNGMLIRVIVVAGIVVALMHLMRPIRVLPLWDWNSFLLLLKTGVPIFLLDYLASSASTCDRLVLLRLGGVTVVGYYAVALVAREATEVVPRALGEYVYPRMSHSYGEHGDLLRLWKMALKSSILAVAIMIPLAVAGWFLMPLVVSKLFPKYAQAVTAAQLLLVAAVFSGATLGRIAIWSLKSWRLMVWYQILASGLLVVGPIVGGVLWSVPLTGVSAGVLAAQVILCPITWYLIYTATHPSTANSTPGEA
jgi:O-antigen/teichoic acid export membrane protein